MADLNWSLLRDALLVGSAPRTASDLDTLRAVAGVTAVLSLQHDDDLRQEQIDYPDLVRHGRALGLTLARCPLRNFDADDQRRNLPAAVRALHGLLRQGHRVYVHCHFGYNRAPLVAVAHLMLIEGLSPADALDLLGRARPRAFPNWAVYFGCCEELTARHFERIRQRAVELGQGSAPRPDSEVWRQAERDIWREALTAE
jgi:atypical dual specificity phosphatase